MTEELSELVEEMNEEIHSKSADEAYYEVAGGEEFVRDVFSLLRKPIELRDDHDGNPFQGGTIEGFKNAVGHFADRLEEMDIVDDAQPIYNRLRREAINTLSAGFVDKYHGYLREAAELTSERMNNLSYDEDEFAGVLADGDTLVYEPQQTSTDETVECVYGKGPSGVQAKLQEKIDEHEGRTVSHLNMTSHNDKDKGVTACAILKQLSEE